MNKVLKLKNPKGKKEIVLDDNEFLEVFLEDFHGGSRDFALKVVLRGKAAQCLIKGRLQVTEKDCKRWKIEQYCLGADQHAKIDLHGTAEDCGRIELDVGGVVEKKSKGVSMEVVEHIWLFAKGQGRALPVLNVHTNDIHFVHHSASVAPLDENKTLFLLSRGIPKNKAHEMLKAGFLKF